MDGNQTPKRLHRGRAGHAEFAQGHQIAETLSVEGVKLSPGPEDDHSAFAIDLRRDCVGQEAGGALPAQEKGFVALTPSDEPAGAEDQRHLVAGDQPFRAALAGDQQV